MSKHSYVVDPVLEAEYKKAPIDWTPTLMLTLTPIAALILVPWFGLTYGFSVGAIVTMVLFIIWNGLGITAGYHRLWSHKTYEAHPVVRFFLLIGGTMAIQNTVFEWCAGHRIHHQHVDHPYKDPYSAKRGFLFSHIGWMMRSYPTSRYDFKNIKDLKQDPMLVAQDKYYGIWILLTNVGLPAVIGLAIGDLWGTLILAGLLRLVISHHVTFFINSLAHTIGKQPYTDTNTARDNWWLALITWGEGYHNYHHYFQMDFRNGIKWWQYDPTKWLIAGLSKVGLTSNLKVVSNLQIKQAELSMRFKTAQQRIQLFGYSIEDDLHDIKMNVQHEYEAFSETLERWKRLKEESIVLKKQALIQKKEDLQGSVKNTLHEIDHKLKSEFHQLETSLHDHSQRLEVILRDFKRKVRAAA